MSFYQRRGQRCQPTCQKNQEIGNFSQKCVTPAQ